MRADRLVRTALVCVFVVTVVAVTAFWQRAIDQPGTHDPPDRAIHEPAADGLVMGASVHRSAGTPSQWPEGSVGRNPGGHGIGPISRHVIGTGVTAEVLGSVGPAPAYSTAQPVLRNNDGMLLAGRLADHVPAAVRQATGLDTSEMWVTEDGDAVILAIDGGGELQVLTLHAGEHRADFDLDGTIRESDLEPFVKAWAAR